MAVRSSQTVGCSPAPWASTVRFIRRSCVWARRRREKVGVSWVARNAACGPRFATASGSRSSVTLARAISGCLRLGCCSSCDCSRAILNCRADAAPTDLASFQARKRGGRRVAPTSPKCQRGSSGSPIERALSRRRLDANGLSDCKNLKLVLPALIMAKTGSAPHASMVSGDAHAHSLSTLPQSD
jgi:hypothetical protein